MKHARIIALVNQKGGPGKTTIAMHLAGTLARRSFKVLVVDADPQGTATRWASSAPDDAEFPAGIARLGGGDVKLHREVKKFLTDYDFIVIDCPPSADSPVSSLLYSLQTFALYLLSRHRLTFGREWRSARL